MTAPAQPRAGAEHLEQNIAGRATGPETHAVDADAATTVQEVGILFVHGMGEHQRGDFLRQIGEPLYLWMAAWLGQVDPNARHRPLRARESSFRVPHLEDNNGPAHSVVETIVDGVDGRRRRITWLAVDGWWTDEVVPPTFSQVASWGLGLAPWMIVRYFRRHWHGLLVVPSLVLVVFFQLVILALSIFGAVPRLRNYVTGLQLRITGSIGNVMVMVASPLQFNAMATRLASDLRWLHAQMPQGRIAVVAHSQGTGVAHAALQVSDVPVDLLVTFGTALEKLHVAREVQQNPRRLALGSSLTIVGGVLLALAAATALKMGIHHLTASASVVGRWVLGAGIVLLMARMALWFQLRRLGGALLTLGSNVIVLLGLVLTAAALIGPDSPWRVSLRAMTASRFWQAWSANGWLSFALGFFAFGLLMVLVREYTAFFMRERYVAGGPRPHARGRSVERSGPLGSVLDPRSVAGNLVGAVALNLAVFCFGMATPPDQSAEGNSILILVVAGLAFCFAAVPVPIAKVTEPMARDFRLPRREGRLRWHNYWASADPVPDGNLPIDTTPYVTNHELRNQSSILTDHTSYTENREEFLADLMLRLSDLAGWAAVQPEDACAIARAERRRRWRVSFLTADRWASSVGMAMTWWILGSAGLAFLGRPLVAVVGYLAGILPGVDRQSVERWLPETLLGMVMVAAIASFWYRGVVSPVWRYWDLVEADVLARRERLDSALAGERRVAVALFALTSAMGLCAAVWSPNLVLIAVDLRKVVQINGRDNILGWPWQREVLLHTGLWGLPWPYIGIVALVVTVLYAAVIQASIRANSQQASSI